jgi:type IV secretory pathway component VirB8
MPALAGNVWRREQMMDLEKTPTTRNERNIARAIWLVQCAFWGGTVIIALVVTTLK